MSKGPMIEGVGGIKGFSSTTKINQDASVRVGTKVILEFDGDVSTDKLRELAKRGPVKVTIEAAQIALADESTPKKGKVAERVEAEKGKE